MFRQGWRGSPQAPRWGRGGQVGRGSPAWPMHPQQHGRQGNTYPHSPSRPVQYGVYGPGAPPPVYQVSDARGTPDSILCSTVLLSSALTEGQAHKWQACCFLMEADLMRLVHSLDPS